MVEVTMEEYQNDVCNIVPKPESKSVVSSKWIYKIKHVANGRKYLWLKDSLREGELIDYEETLALGRKVHFHHNYHGTFFHDEVGYTPDRCKDNPFLMVSLRKRFTSNNHKDLKLKTK